MIVFMIMKLVTELKKGGGGGGRGGEGVFVKQRYIHARNDTKKQILTKQQLYYLQLISKLVLHLSKF